MLKIDAASSAIPEPGAEEALAPRSKRIDFKPWLAKIRENRRSYTTCLTVRLRNADLEELPGLVLAQALECLRAKRLNAEEQEKVLSAAGVLTAAAWEDANFESLDLLDDLRAKCSNFDISKLSDFWESHVDELKRKEQKVAVIKAIFYGSWHHLEAWNSGEPKLRRLFPKLSHLLKVATTSDGSARIKALLGNATFLMENLKLEGASVVQFANFGDVGSKVAALRADIEVEQKTKPIWVFLIEELGLSGRSVGKFCYAGCIAKKVADITSSIEVEGALKPAWIFLVEDLGMCEASVGRIVCNRDVGEKLSDLKSSVDLRDESRSVWAFLKEDLGLSGSSISKLASAVGLRERVNVLRCKIEVEGSEKTVWSFLLQDLGFSETMVSSFLVAKNINEKVSILISGVQTEGGEKLLWKFVTEDLGLRGKALFLFVFSGSVSDKIEALTAETEVGGRLKPAWRILTEDLEFSARSIGLFCSVGSTEGKVEDLTTHRETISVLGIKGSRLAGVFASGTREVVKKNLLLLSEVRSVLEENRTFTFDNQTNVFPQVFSSSLAGYVATEKLGKTLRESSEIFEFFGSVDFDDLFIQTAARSPRGFSDYIRGLTTNKDYQYLLLVYLTGNRAVGFKQWEMLRNMVNGAGRGSCLFHQSWGQSESSRDFLADTHALRIFEDSCRDEPQPENTNLANILTRFFVDFGVTFNKEELESIQAFVSSLGRIVDKDFLSRLLPIFGSAMELKQFLLGEIETAEIEALTAGISDS